MENISTSTLTIDNAMQIIAGIETEIYATGAVDCEPNILENIRQRLTSREITPGEAVRRARSLAESRQNYH